MALDLPLMLSTNVLRPASVASRFGRPELIRRDDPGARAVEPGGPGPDDLSAQTMRRTRIWEFGANLHCSIVGTCLTTGELRHILVKLKVGDAAAASDHDLHSLRVALAGRRDSGAKLLQKALDRRHCVAIIRYSRAKDVAALLALWEESLKLGEIPGAYWAALTHPLTDDDVVKRVFGDVHMLSHLVGAANRADIRRLRQLEQDNAALTAKIERQQRQLREGFTLRDVTIDRLNAMLAKQTGVRPEKSDAAARQGDGEAADDVIRDLNKRLAREIARRERSDQRVAELSATVAEWERAMQASRQERDSVLQELQLVEAHLAGLVQPEMRAAAEPLELSGVTILYVGGRPHQVPQLKGMIERAGACFLHHDGGLEHSSALLPGLVSRADHVLFPIDCVSHDAAGLIKKLCRQTAKSYEPLRTASLASLISALARMGRAAGRVAAE
jgi:hypothetical protein